MCGYSQAPEPFVLLRGVNCTLPHLLSGYEVVFSYFPRCSCLPPCSLPRLLDYSFRRSFTSWLAHSLTRSPTHFLTQLLKFPSFVVSPSFLPSLFSLFYFIFSIFFVLPIFSIVLPISSIYPSLILLLCIRIFILFSLHFTLFPFSYVFFFTTFVFPLHFPSHLSSGLLLFLHSSIYFFYSLSSFCFRPFPLMSSFRS